MATDEYCMRVLYYTVRNMWRGGQVQLVSFFPPSSLHPRNSLDIDPILLLLSSPSLPRSVIRWRKEEGRGGRGGSRYRVSSWRILFFGARVTYPHDELRGEIMGEGAWCKFTLIEVHANDPATSVSRVCLRDHDSFYFSRVNNLFHVA